MKGHLAFALIFVIAIFLPAISFSQEETAEEIEYSYGTVVRVDDAKKAIVIAEYDYDNDEEISVTYSIDPEIKFEEVSSLKEIEPGYYVDIEYVVGKDQKRIAKFISAYKPESEFE